MKSKHAEKQDIDRETQLLALIQKLEERIIELERKFDTAVRGAEYLAAGNDRWYWDY